MKNITGWHNNWKLSVVNSLVLGGTITLTSCLAIASSGNYAWGQITSDGTVGSQVNSPIPGTFLINGGATRGSNLFHSFSEFSVPSNGIAYFNNQTPIQNIIARVTGGSISNIDGLIKANGTANLFFLNPNGIIFGPNAKLQIYGSFLASTANSLNFADGTKFSATASQTKPLLTVSAPLGLQYGNNIGNIQVQGSELRVNNGQTLALMGGKVQINNAFLEAPGGRVELGGLAQPGTVGLNVDGNKLRLSFPSDVARADVFLTNESVVNVVAEGGGNIKIYGHNLTIDNSIVVAGIKQGLGFVGAQAGDITLDTKENINIGNNSAIANVVFRGATGNSGNIDIKARSFRLTGSSKLATVVFGEGQGNVGKIVVQAEDSVLLTGDRTILSSSIDKGAVGKAGEINIQTRSLSLSDDAQIGAITAGQGNAGKILIQASDSVSLAGRLTGILSSVVSGAVGQGGEININTGSLSLTDGAGISATTWGQGDAGNITVKADKSIVLVNGQIQNTVQEEAIGQGGKINIQADLLSLSEGAFIDSSLIGKGSGGDIKVQVGSLSLTGDSVLSASTFGWGNAGNILVRANNSISMNNSNIFTGVDSQAVGQGGDISIQTRLLGLTKASISGETASNLGGNITLNVQDVLLMRQGSRISTTAGTAKAGGDGGNIDIDSLFIVAVPKENSDITANAYTGKGGNINITTQGIYGLEFRPRLTPFSDITASSEFGVNGTVQINTSGIDPSRGLNNLPVEPVTLEVTEGCQGEGKPGSVAFFNTGKGGLAPNPYEPLSSSNIWEDVSLSTPSTANSTSPPQTIVEAQSWIVNEKGEVVLVAEIPVTRSPGRCRLR